MQTCKCGATKLGPLIGPKGTTFEVGCPSCKDTVKVTA